MRVKGGMVGLALLALLVCAPAAMGSTASLRNGTTVVYAGDVAADTVTLSRVVNNGQPTISSATVASRPARGASR